MAPGIASPQRTFSRDLLLRIGKQARRPVNEVITRYSEVGNPSIFSPEVFPWTASLEAHWREVRDEADAILAERSPLAPVARISPDHARIAPGDGWRSFILYGYGYRVDENCRRCPATTKLLQQVPGLQTAFFSVIEPGGYLKRHRGVTKAIITCHLGLRVPRRHQDCVIRIKRKLRSWKEGKVLLFDDTRKHEVWNMTDEPRMVLLMHVLRPVRFPGNVASRGFLAAVRHSPFIRDARRNQTRWNRRGADPSVR